MSPLPRIVSLEDTKTVEAIDNQWRRLPSALALLPEDIHKEHQPDKFWSKLLKYKNGEGLSEFEELATFALSVLSLPHSNASCERIFSQVNSFFNP